MELISEERGKKIYLDGNKKYTMIDMGPYVGHMSRDWYIETPSVWFLMQVEGKDFSVESLIDSNGEYIRLLAKTGNVTRVLQMNGDKVYSDSIFVGENLSNELMGDNYIAKEGDYYSKDSIKLEKYLLNKPEFFSQGNKYEGKVPDNNLFIDIIEKNIELNKLINSITKSKTI